MKARWCAWHDGPMRWRDRVLRAIGCRLSHGMCPACERAMEGR